MHKHLVIRLPQTDTEKVYWHSESGSGETSVESLGSLHSLQPETGCILLLPGAAFSLHRVAYKGKVTGARFQALCWQLEDDLCEDVEQLHFACVGQDEQAVYMVTVAKELMVQWLSWTGKAGLFSPRWLPEIFALPWRQGQCTQLDFGNHCLLRRGEWQVMACENEWLPLALTAMGAAGDEDSVHSLEVSAKQPLEHLYPQAVLSGINIRQGEWKAESPVSRNWLSWRTSAVLAVLCLGLFAGRTWMDISRMDAQHQAQVQKARATYHKLFPEERIVRLESQLRQKLARLNKGQDAGERGVLKLLDQLAPALQAVPDLQLQTLDYSQVSGELLIDVNARSYSSISRFRTQVSAILDVTLKATEQKGRGVSGQLVIREKSA